MLHGGLVRGTKHQVSRESCAIRAGLCYAHSMTEPKLTTAQVADKMGVDDSTVRRWCAEGKLPHIRTLGGHIRIPQSAVTELLKGDAA